MSDFVWNEVHEEHRSRCDAWDCCETYHVGSEPGRCHGREIGRTSVVLAATDDCYSSKLTCGCCQISIPNKYILMDSLPLWNDSSMGGIILYTLPKSSLRDKLEAMIVDCVYSFLVDGIKKVVFQFKMSKV